MAGKIFKSIFFTALAVLALCFLAFFGIAYFSLQNDGRTELAEQLLNIIPTSFLVMALLIATVAFVASRLSRSIVKPIKELDTERPERTPAYEELKPVIKRISYQNYKIASQLRELGKKESEFNSIISNMSEGMIVINSKAEILSCNKGAREILGVLEELPHSILSVISTEGFRFAVLEALAGRNGYDTLRSGERHYAILVTPVKNDAKTEGALIVIIDDTEKEEREALRREFTSNASHELKTPLTSLSGFAELIQGGVAEGEDAKRFAGNIYKEAQRLISVVGDIIRLTQLDGGELPYDDEPIELVEVCREVSERLSFVAEEKGVELSIVGKCGAVRGNRQSLEELVYNLVDNGIKYSKANGFVKMLLYDDRDLPTLVVKDNGIGIPKDKQNRVFERFYRVDKSHSKSIGGTGLGLSIVKHSAMYHRAKISLRSEFGEGTEITVSFPKI